MKSDCGKIIIVKNLIFINHDNRSVIDHAYKCGRPCIIISELDSYYILPLSSKMRNIESSNSFTFSKNKVFNYSTYGYDIDKMQAKIESLKKIKICGYEECGTLYNSTYLHLLYWLKSYYCVRPTHITYTTYKEIEQDIEEQIMELKKYKK